MGPDDIEIVFENYETGQRKPTRKPDTARLLPKQSNLAPESDVEEYDNTDDESEDSYESDDSSDASYFDSDDDAQCSVCAKKFQNSAGLKRHVRLVHPNNEDDTDTKRSKIIDFYKQIYNKSNGSDVQDENLTKNNGNSKKNSTPNAKNLGRVNSRLNNVTSDATVTSVKNRGSSQSKILTDPVKTKGPVTRHDQSARRPGQTVARPDPKSSKPATKPGRNGARPGKRPGPNTTISSQTVTTPGPSTSRRGPSASRSGSSAKKQHKIVKCDKCPHEFESQMLLDLHRHFIHDICENDDNVVDTRHKSDVSSTVNDKRNTFSCDNCQQSFKMSGQLSLHQKRCKGQKASTEEPTSSSTETPSTYNITTVHINSSALKVTFKKTTSDSDVEDVNEESNSDVSIDANAKVSDTGIIRCGECGESFTDYLDLLEHVQNDHLRKKKALNPDSGSEDDLPLSALRGKVVKSRHRSSKSSSELISESGDNILIDDSGDDLSPQVEESGTPLKSPEEDHVEDEDEDDGPSSTHLTTPKSSQKTDSDGTKESDEGIKCGECKEPFEDFIGLMSHIANNHLSPKNWVDPEPKGGPASQIRGGRKKSVSAATAQLNFSDDDDVIEIETVSKSSPSKRGKQPPPASAKNVQTNQRGHKNRSQQAAGSKGCLSNDTNSGSSQGSADPSTAAPVQAGSGQVESSSDIPSPTKTISVLDKSKLRTSRLSSSSTRFELNDQNVKAVSITDQPKLSNPDGLGSSVKCGACKERFVDYFALMAHIQHCQSPEEAEPEATHLEPVQSKRKRASSVNRIPEAASSNVNKFTDQSDHEISKDSDVGASTLKTVQIKSAHSVALTHDSEPAAKEGSLPQTKPCFVRASEILSVPGSSVCGECGKQFDGDRIIFNHVRTAHLKSSDRHFSKCELCGDIFLEQSYLQFHVQSVHQSIENVVEERSTTVKKKRGRPRKKTMSDQGNMTNPDTLPTDQLHFVNCLECGDKFFELQHLEQHLELKHRAKPQQKVGTTSVTNPDKSEENVSSVTDEPDFIDKSEALVGTNGDDRLLEEVKPCSVPLKKLPINPEVIEKLRKNQQLAAEQRAADSGAPDDQAKAMTTVFNLLDVKHEEGAGRSDQQMASRPANPIQRKRACPNISQDYDLKPTNIKLISLNNLLGSEGSLKTDPSILINDKDRSIILSGSPETCSNRVSRSLSPEPALKRPRMGPVSRPKTIQNPFWTPPKSDEPKICPKLISMSAKTRDKN